MSFSSSRAQPSWCPRWPHPLSSPRQPITSTSLSSFQPSFHFYFTKPQTYTDARCLRLRLSKFGRALASPVRVRPWLNITSSPPWANPGTRNPPGSPASLFQKSVPFHDVKNTFVVVSHTREKIWRWISIIGAANKQDALGLSFP